jgi:hypothetical protein
MRGVSFVAVTQQFNTTTSMGRLTLKVLLSFAQFEREVTGERIRDKIAASKKKGMWMGGVPPLCYDVRKRRLMVNPEEAETVSYIYRRYLQLGSVRGGICFVWDRGGLVFVACPAQRTREGTPEQIGGGRNVTIGAQARNETYRAPMSTTTLCERDPSGYREWSPAGDGVFDQRQGKLLHAWRRSKALRWGSRNTHRYNGGRSLEVSLCLSENCLLRVLQVWSALVPYAVSHILKAGK